MISITDIVLDLIRGVLLLILGGTTIVMQLLLSNVPAWGWILAIIFISWGTVSICKVVVRCKKGPKNIENLEHRISSLIGGNQYPTTSGDKSTSEKEGDR
jgi:hypothetical protein